MENTVALIQMKGLPEFTPLTYGADPAKGTYPFHLFWNCDHVKKAMEGLYIYIYIYTRTISIKEIVQSKDVLFIMSNYSLSKMSYSQIQM